MNGLDLFSGIGGISQALAPWVRTIAYCERERYPQAVLLSRMERGEIDVAPIWDDVCTLHAGMLPRIDIISGGFPCQDLSVAGLRKGLAGERSGLFFEIVRLTRELQPRFVFMENVAGIFAGDTLGAVGGALAAIGYDCRWGVLSAYDVGAPHLRERWFCLAHASSNRGDKQSGLGGIRREKETKQAWLGGATLAHASGKRLERRAETLRQKKGRNGHTRYDWEETCFNGGNDQWAIEPAVGRVANGIPMRNDRLKCLGNGVVPIQVREAFMRLSGLKDPWGKI